MKTLLHTIVFVLLIGFSHAGSAFNDAFELNQKGETHALKGNFNEAIHSYETAVDMFPSYGTAYINLVKMYYQVGNFQRVIEMAKTALDVVPNSADLHYFMGSSYLKLGNSDLGKTAITNAIAINPNYQTMYTSNIGSGDSSKDITVKK